MKVLVKRSHNDEVQGYTVDFENVTLLTILNHIKTKVDSTLTFSQGCRSGVCGSCAVRVNGREVLMCEYKPNDGDLVEPMRNATVVRDLVVESSAVEHFNRTANTWSEASREGNVTEEDMRVIETQSDCILCTACYSACPVYAVNPNFIGPFALTRVWRYVSDPRQTKSDVKIAAIQTNGIWDCTLCGECVPVCPQGIAPKQDITMLRSKSAMLGYNDPNMSFVGGLDFGAPMF